MKRLLVLVTGLIGVMGVLGVATPAHAYPPAQPAVTVSDTTVDEDGFVTFSGVATEAGETMTISVAYASGGGGVLGTAISDAEGAWSFRAQLTESGWATLTAVGNLGTPARSIRVLVLETGGSGGGGGLAKTGDNGMKLPAMVLSGAGAIMLGGLLVFGAVRWRRRTSSADLA